MKIKSIEYLRNMSENIFRDFVPILKINDMTKFIRNCGQNKNLVGVEIGVNTGFNSKNILQMLPIKKLYLVDPYLEDELYGNSEKRKSLALQNVQKYDNKIKFYFLKSNEAINHVSEKLDFVYVDGDHSYDAVKEDINLWYPKVKEGGVFGGDDFSPRCPGVAKAVLEFIDKNNLELKCGKSTVWWVIKK